LVAGSVLIYRIVPRRNGDSAGAIAVITVGYWRALPVGYWRALPVGYWRAFTVGYWRAFTVGYWRALPVGYWRAFTTFPCARHDACYFSQF
jgi:hypothetical protein